MAAQRRRVVGGAHEATPAQQRHHGVDQQIEIERQHGRQDVEAVAGLVAVPFGEPRRELFGRADEAGRLCPGSAIGELIELIRPPARAGRAERPRP